MCYIVLKRLTSTKYNIHIQDIRLKLSSINSKHHDLPVHNINISIITIITCYYTIV